MSMTWRAISARLYLERVHHVRANQNMPFPISRGLHSSTFQLNLSRFDTEYTLNIS